MCRALLIILVLTFTLSPAEARHRHWGLFGFAFIPHEHHRHAHHQDRYSSRRNNRAVVSADTESFPETRTYSKADLVPQDWQLQPTDSTFKGQRFVSPDGSSWLEIYASPANREPIANHMKAVAFGDGEQVTSLHGEENWVEVSGFKADRMFYRKVLLACAGRSWHEIAYEYPQENKDSMSQFVSRAGDAVQNSEDQGCEPPDPTSVEATPSPNIPTEPSSGRND